MAQGQPAQQGMLQRAASVVGDLAGFWRKPEELSAVQVPQQSQVPQGQPQQNGQQGQQQQQTKQPAGATAKGATNDPETIENPLDVYKDLFNNTPNKDKDGKDILPPEPPAFKLDAKTIKDAAGKIDFMSDLPPELAEKLQSGQMDATSTAALVSHVGQQAYARAIEHATTLTDRYVGMRLNHEQQGLPAQVQRLLAKHTAISNPAIRNNPVLKEHYEMISERLSTRYPDQPPEWVAEQTNKYFTDMAKAVNPKLGEVEHVDQGIQTNARGETTKDGKVFDWQAYLKD